MELVLAEGAREDVEGEVDVVGAELVEEAVSLLLSELDLNDADLTVREGVEGDGPPRGDADPPRLDRLGLAGECRSTASPRGRRKALWSFSVIAVMFRFAWDSVDGRSQWKAR